jgi:flagellar basal body-associated protein FliL
LRSFLLLLITIMIVLFVFAIAIIVFLVIKIYCSTLHSAKIYLQTPIIVDCYPTTATNETSTM